MTDIINIGGILPNNVTFTITFDGVESGSRRVEYIRALIRNLEGQINLACQGSEKSSNTSTIKVAKELHEELRETYGSGPTLEDEVSRFFDEATTQAKGRKISSLTLYRAYDTWAHVNNTNLASVERFNDICADLGKIRFIEGKRAFYKDIVTRPIPIRTDEHLIKDLPLSFQIRDFLQGSGLNTVGQLRALSETKLRRLLKNNYKPVADLINEVIP